MNNNLETITLGAGCFWCVEAVFKRISGVEKVISGYMGGQNRPTYDEVCTGESGHAEVVQVSFSPLEVQLKKILEVFWSTHDPTTLNRQGNDIGTQYRSVIFYHNETQADIARELKKDIQNIGIFHSKIVTEIQKAGEFYPAEDYHHNYYDLNKDAPYCQFIIAPKIEKLTKQFKSDLK